MNNLKGNTMKRIIHFTSIILLVAALYSCTGQYDGIDKYATDETVYVGKYSDIPYVRTGYKRVEIELLGDSIGRALTDDIYLGKAKRTIVEFDEADGRRVREFDSVCSWVNITGLVTPKTYIFTIYAEDGEGNRSIPTEALGKPYTDSDFNGIEFPVPHVIPTPETVEFSWDEASMGLSSPLFKFIELIYSYNDRNNKPVSGKLTAKDIPTFNLKNLRENDSTTVILNCRIIPVAESGLILDTLPMIKEFKTKTATEQEYADARDTRPIESALIDNNDNSQAWITFGSPTDHLAYTEIRYIKSSTNAYATVSVDNGSPNLLCTDIKRGSLIQIRGIYNPPETDRIIPGSWVSYGTFSVKYDTRDWVVIPRSGSIEYYWPDGYGNQSLWSGGHPMLAIDDDPKSSWHSIDANREKLAPLPQVLVIDMKESRTISRIVAAGGYWKTVEVYLTDDLSIPDYRTHTVDWYGDFREAYYNNWVIPYQSKIPGTVPPSWGTPIVRGAESQSHTFNLTSTPAGRFLIIRFPDNTDWRPDFPSTFISVSHVEVYGI
jgi:hypothetical protein